MAVFTLMNGLSVLPHLELCEEKIRSVNILFLIALGLRDLPTPIFLLIALSLKCEAKDSKTFLLHT